MIFFQIRSCREHKITFLRGLGHEYFCAYLKGYRPHGLDYSGTSRVLHNGICIGYVKHAYPWRGIKDIFSHRSGPEFTNIVRARDKFFWKEGMLVFSETEA